MSGRDAVALSWWAVALFLLMLAAITCAPRGIDITPAPAVVYDGPVLELLILDMQKKPIEWAVILVAGYAPVRGSVATFAVLGPTAYRVTAYGYAPKSGFLLPGTYEIYLIATSSAECP